MAAITFLPLVRDHLPLLRQWLREPHVAEFWQEPADEVEFRDKYLQKLQDRGVRPYLICLDAQPIGYIQCYEAKKLGGGWWPDAPEGQWGVDQFLGDPSLVGKGLGAAILRQFVAQLFADPAITEIITDPDPENGRAIRMYEKVGFSRMGEIATPSGRALLLRLPRSR